MHNFAAQKMISPYAKKVLQTISEALQETAQAKLKGLESMDYINNITRKLASRGLATNSEAVQSTISQAINEHKALRVQGAIRINLPKRIYDHLICKGHIHPE